LKIVEVREADMSTRKTVGWVIFAALVIVILIQVPSIASRMCYRAGRNLYAAGKYQQAASAYRGSVFFDHGFAQGYIQLGAAYRSLEKYPLAEKAFLSAKALSDDSYAACGLGMVYHDLHRDEAAEKEFLRAMSLNPKDDCAYSQMARMKYDLGKYHEAIEGYKHALTMTQTSGLYVHLGNSYVYAREYEPAVEAYKQALQLNSKNEVAHYQLAVAYDYLRRYEEAAAEYKETLKLDPKDASSHYALAQIYLALHNKPAALEQYEILRKSDPTTATDLLKEIVLPDVRERGKEKLYFVPLNNYSAAEVTKLVNFCKQKTGVQPIVTQPVPFVLTTVDKKRQQVIAEEAVELIRVKYPEIVADPNAVVIGLTDEDMYIRKENWQWAFGYWTQRRFAVISSARLNPANLGGAANDALTETRLRKMLLKNIGVLFYLYPANYDPKSVLYDGVHGVEDIDKMGEDF
jgi:tetratricopeptide (TPR) repeat protein